MQTVKTIPGKTYAVESAGEVIITNAETGAIAAQGDGSGQVLFTAIANFYEVSDDTAKVVALFKLAPRLKLTLLQGVAGGWLPKGFTELEYLESSGTQYIDTGILGNNETEIRCRFRINKYSVSGQRVYGSYATNKNITYYANAGSGGNVRFGVDSLLIVTPAEETISSVQNASGVSVNGDFKPYTQTSVFETASSLYLFNLQGFNSGELLQGRVYSFECWKSGQLAMKLIPALRKEDRVPGMWDSVSKTFFENIGSGRFGYRIKATGEVVKPNATTFSLRAPRDPYYVAPSGVYARTVGENELEVLADTEETSGEGWEWFANTAEAYEYFGIVQDNEELLTE